MTITIPKRSLRDNPDAAKQEVCRRLRMLCDHIDAGHCLSFLYETDILLTLKAPELWPAKKSF